MDKGDPQKPEWDHERSSQPNKRNAWAGLTLGVAFIYLAFLPPGIYSVDGNAMLAVAESLVAHHSFAVQGDVGEVGRGGQIFSKWYPLQSLLAVPFVAAGVQIAHVLRLPEHYVAAICSLVLPALFTGLTALLVALISEQLGSSPRGAFLAGLTYAFGTIAMVYARTFYADPLLALLTAACIYLALAGGRQGIFRAAPLTGLAVLAKPTGIVVGPLITFYLWPRRIRKNGAWRTKRCATLPLKNQWPPGRTCRWACVLCLRQARWRVCFCILAITKCASVSR